jgi:hypothetical protein
LNECSVHRPGSGPYHDVGVICGLVTEGGQRFWFS